MKIRVTVATIVRLFKVDAVADLGGGGGGGGRTLWNLIAIADWLLDTIEI